MKLRLLDNTFMSFRDRGHAEKLFAIIPTENLMRLYLFQQEKVQEIIFNELVTRKIIFNEIKECLMVEKKYDESHDKIPTSTWIMAGIIILVIILGSILF